MDRLLALLLSLFSDIDSVQKLFSRLVERILKDVPDAAGCKARLLALLQSQTLDEEFKKDPICVLVCIGQVVIDVVAHMHGHDHNHNVDPNNPVIVISGEDQQIYHDLAVALGCEIPVQGNEEEEKQIDLLFLILLEALEVLLKRLLEKENQE